MVRAAIEVWRLGLYDHTYGSGPLTRIASMNSGAAKTYGGGASGSWVKVEPHSEGTGLLQLGRRPQKAPEVSRDERRLLHQWRGLAWKHPAADKHDWRKQEQGRVAQRDVIHPIQPRIDAACLRPSWEIRSHRDTHFEY